MTCNYKWGKDLSFKIDGASATIVDITSYVTNAALRSAVGILDATPIGASTLSSMHGLANINVPISFFVNSTTDAIFGPLMNRTCSQKTVGFYNGIKWYTGEFLPQNVEFSGDSKSLIMGSCDLIVSGGSLSRTSVAPA